MKKFYKNAEAGTAPGSYTVRLDGKLIKTPLHHPLLLDSLPLATAIAQEWNAQEGNIQPTTMPLTQLANTMIDKAKGPDRAAMNASLIEYGSSDLVCYLATHPQDLVTRQEHLWLNLLDWMAEQHHITLTPVKGIQYHHQSTEDVTTLRQIVEALSPRDFTIVQFVTGVTGSLVIALALCHGHMDASTAYEAACIDEIYQLEKWGEDKPARDRLNRIRADLEIAVDFLRLTTPTDS